MCAIKRAPNWFENLKNKGHHYGTSLLCPSMGVPTLGHEYPSEWKPTPNQQYIIILLYSLFQTQLTCFLIHTFQTQLTY